MMIRFIQPLLVRRGVAVSGGLRDRIGRHRQKAEAERGRRGVVGGADVGAGRLARFLRAPRGARVRARGGASARVPIFQLGAMQIRSIASL